MVSAAWHRTLYVPLFSIRALQPNVLPKAVSAETVSAGVVDEVLVLLGDVLEGKGGCLHADWTGALHRRGGDCGVKLDRSVRIVVRGAVSHRITDISESKVFSFDI